MTGRLLYWIAVVAVAAALSYLLIRLAEGLDASQVNATLQAALMPRG